MFDRKEWIADVISLEDSGHELDLRSFNIGRLLDSPTCSLLLFTAPDLGRRSLSPYIYKD